MGGDIDLYMGGDPVDRNFDCKQHNICSVQHTDIHTDRSRSLDVGAIEQTNRLAIEVNIEGQISPDSRFAPFAQSDLNS